MARNKQEKLSFKEAIFKRDNYRCLMCGNIYDSHFLILYFDTPGGKPTNNNIITLCKACETLLYEGSKWKEDGKQVSYRWNKADIINFRSEKQIQRVYPNKIGILKS